MDQGGDTKPKRTYRRRALYDKPVGVSLQPNTLKDIERCTETFQLSQTELG